MTTHLTDDTFQSNALNKLKEESNWKTERDRFNYGVTLLNALKRELQQVTNTRRGGIASIKDTVDSLNTFICKIIDLIESKDADLMDKYILNILNTYYSENVETMLRNHSINTRAALVVIKYKNNRISIEDALEFIHMNKGAIRRSQVNETEGLDKSSEEIIKKDIVKELKRIYQKAKDKVETTEITIKTKFKKYLDGNMIIHNVKCTRDIEAEYMNILDRKRRIWNQLDVYNEEEITRLIVHEFYNKESPPQTTDRNISCSGEVSFNSPIKHSLSATSLSHTLHLVTVNKYLNFFFNGINFLKKGEIFNAVSCFNEIHQKQYLNILVRDLLSLAYFYDLKYNESRYYTGLNIQESQNTNETQHDHIERHTADYSNGLPYSLDISFFLDRIAGVFSPCSSVVIGHSLIMYDNLSLFPLLRHISHSGNTLDNIICKYTNRYPQWISDKITGKHEILHCYIHNNTMWILNYYNMSNTKVLDNFSEYLNMFDEIFIENRRIIKNVTVKEEWWKERYDLDRRLKVMLKKIKYFVNTTRVFLLLEGATCKLPIETAIYRENKKTSEIFRITELGDALKQKEKMNVSNSFYLLDPKNNLPRTRETMGRFVTSLGLERGVAGRGLDAAENDTMNQRENFFYFGHGTGKDFYKIGKECKLTRVMLFGCSSIRLLSYKPSVSAPLYNLSSDSLSADVLSGLVQFKSNGFLLKINKGKLVIGCLWDITDVDLDNMSINYIRNEEEEFNQVKIIKGCKMKYLNGAALVGYYQ